MYHTHLLAARFEHLRPDRETGSLQKTSKEGVFVRQRGVRVVESSKPWMGRTPSANSCFGAIL